MLTDQDKENIILEETYRHEVRTRLQDSTAKKSKWERILPTLNSGIVLWFLSSVVLGVTGFLYTRWDHHRSLEQERKERIMKLDAEIANRLVFFSRFTRTVRHRDQDNWIATISGMDKMVKAVQGLEDPTSAGYRINIFPEYASRSLRSLLLELKEIVPLEEKIELEEAYKKSLALLDLYLAATRNQESPQPRKSETVLKMSISQIDLIVDWASAFNLGRWNYPFRNDSEWSGQQTE